MIHYKNWINKLTGIYLNRQYMRHLKMKIEIYRKEAAPHSTDWYCSKPLLFTLWNNSFAISQGCIIFQMINWNIKLLTGQVLNCRNTRSPRGIIQFTRLDNLWRSKNKKISNGVNRRTESPHQREIQNTSKSRTLIRVSRKQYERLIYPSHWNCTGQGKIGMIYPVK